MVMEIFEAIKIKTHTQKEWDICILQNAELQKHCAKWKNPGPKDHT